MLDGGKAIRFRSKEKMKKFFLDVSSRYKVLKDTSKKPETDNRNTD